MKKNLIFAAFAAVSVLSCTKEAYTPAEVSPVTIQASIADLATKVSFDPTYASMKPTSMALTWADGDQLRVYNHADHSQYSDFALAAGSIGQKTGVFTGTPVTATSYDVEIINGTVAYGTQAQPSDGVTSGLKYLASASDVADLGTIVFDRFSSVLAITAKMPSTEVAAVIKSVDITASENIFNGGKTLTVAFDTVGDADADGVLHFFATLPEGSTAIPAGTTLLLQFNAPGQAHDVYTRYIELPAGSFTANKLNTVNVNATQSAQHAGAPTCDGTTAANAYLIGDKYQMVAMHDVLVAGSKKYFKMVADVDMEGINWEPLNYVDPWDKAFVFDGDGKTINHFSANGASYAYPSFAGILNGDVKNVTFLNANIQCGSSKGGVVGGYIGHKKKGYKSNCSNVIINKATINSSAMAGALGAQGDNMGTITKCSVINSTITSSGQRVGGLIGSVVAFDEISDCYAEGISFTSTAVYAGGLIGQLDGSGHVLRCYSTGSVEDNLASGNYSRTGGLIGVAVNGTIENCYSTCSVSCTGHFAGGLIGHVDKTVSVSKCYATGEVWLDSGRAQAGGLIGIVAKTGALTVSNCYATGNITSGQRWCGGLIGGAESDASNIPTISVTNCFSSSSITPANSGALIGSNNTTGLTCTGYIGWSTLVNLAGANNAVSTTGNYLGQEGTISAHATTLGWDSNVWDLTGDVPTLK